MSKKDISNKTLATLLIVAIAVSVVGTFIAANKPIYISGMASSGTGTVEVTISGLAAISVTDNIDFGSGYVYPNNITARLESNGTAATNGSWTWAAQDIEIENEGNQKLNITFNASSAASSWIGAGALAYMAANVNAQDGCSVENSTWQTLSTGTSLRLCTDLDSTDGADKVDAEATVLILESTAPSGTAKTVTVTFYGHTGSQP